MLHAEDLTLCKQGWASTEAGQNEQAIKLFESCIQRGGLSAASLARTHRNIGIAYRRARQPDKAIAAFNRAIALRPDDVVDDYLNRGNAHDDAGRFEQALADYALALRLRPGYGDVYYNRGIAYERRKQYEKAKAEFIAAYEHGLRTRLLHDRFVAHGLVER
jgi:tetratricopeptide (TPR) repeat protein